MFVSTIVGRPAQQGKKNLIKNVGLKEQQAWIETKMQLLRIICNNESSIFLLF